MIWSTGPKPPGHGLFKTELCEQWAILHMQSSTHAWSFTCTKKRCLSEGRLCAKLYLWEQRTFTRMELCEQAQAPSTHANFVRKHKRPVSSSGTSHMSTRAHHSLAKLHLYEHRACTLATRNKGAVCAHASVSHMPSHVPGHQGGKVRDLWSEAFTMVTLWYKSPHNFPQCFQ